MLPPSLAFAWLLWRQHRNDVSAFLGYLLFAGAISAVLSPYCSPGMVEFVLGCFFLIGVSAIPVGLLCVFAYGFDGAEGSARESCFPPRLFRLPVPTASLVVWPLVYGAATAILLWLVFAWFILRPWAERLDKGVPLWWPAFFMAALLAWVQALVWSPFGLPWLRVILFSIWIPFLVALASFGSHAPVSEFLLVALYGGLMVIGWAVSYLSVAHARHGHVPDWQAILGPFRQLGRLLPRTRGPLASAARAQVWFEWRRAGKALAFSTALVLVVSLWPLFLGKNDVIPTTQTLLSALAIPVFLAGFSGGGWPGTDKNHWIKDRPGMMPFIATLPMSSANLVGAMLKTSLWSTLSAWTVVIVMLPLALVLTGKYTDVADEWRQIVRDYTPGAIATGIIAITVWLLVWTWKRKVDSLYIGLTGRKWITAAVLWGCILGYSAVFILLKFIYDHPETHETFLTLLPWFLTVLLLGRLLLAGWALSQVFRQGLVQPATVARWLAAWLLLASSLFIVLVQVVSTDQVPKYYLAFAVLFAMPMARLSAAPLAVAWNRHR